MSRIDLDQHDVDALLATHESRKEMEAVLGRHRLPSSRREATAGPGRVLRLLILLCSVVLACALYPLVARLARDLYTIATPWILRLVGA